MYCPDPSPSPCLSPTVTSSPHTSTTSQRTWRKSRRFWRPTSSLSPPSSSTSSPCATTSSSTWRFSPRSWSPTWRSGISSPCLYLSLFPFLGYLVFLIINITACWKSSCSRSLQSSSSAESASSSPRAESTQFFHRIQHFRSQRVTYWLKYVIVHFILWNFCFIQPRRVGHISVYVLSKGASFPIYPFFSLEYKGDDWQSQFEIRPKKRFNRYVHARLISQLYSK